MSPFTYQYPRASLTTDCCVFTFLNNELSVLLVKRAFDPDKGLWALPGGFMNMDETVEQCAVRELFEETGCKIKGELHQFGVYSDPGRDSRGRVVTVAFYALAAMISVSGKDDATEARWFAVNSLPPLAFDHAKIIADAVKEMRKDIYFEPIGFELLPPAFSMAELQKVIESITGESYDRRNFYNKMRHFNFVEEVSEEKSLDTTRRSKIKYFFNSESFNNHKRKKGSGPITY